VEVLSEAEEGGAGNGGRSSQKGKRRGGISSCCRGRTGGIGWREGGAYLAYIALLGGERDPAVESDREGKEGLRERRLLSRRSTLEKGEEKEEKVTTSRPDLPEQKRRGEER